MENQSRLSIYGLRYIPRMCMQLLFQIRIILIDAGTFDINRLFGYPHHTIEKFQHFLMVLFCRLK